MPIHQLPLNQKYYNLLLYLAHALKGFHMFVLESSVYYGTPDLQRMYEVTRPTIWDWRRDEGLPKPSKPFGPQGRCLWPAEQNDNLPKE